MHRTNSLLLALIIPLAGLALILRLLSPAPAPGAAHGCAIFGGRAPPPRQANPGWTGGGGNFGQGAQGGAGVPGVVYVAW